MSVGWLVSWSVGWLADRSVGWLVGHSVDWSVTLSVVLLVGRQYDIISQKGGSLQFHAPNGVLVAYTSRFQLKQTHNKKLSDLIFIMRIMKECP